MRSFRSIGATALALLLVACGGSDGSSSGGLTVVPGAPTPTPAPGPTPTPAPTPAGQTLLNLGSTTQQFAGLDSILLYQRTNAGAISAFENYPTEAGIDLVYDGPGRSLYYIYRATNIPPHQDYAHTLSVQFGAGQKDSARSTASFTVYRNTDSGAQYTLTLLAPGSENPSLALYYTGIGIAQGTLTDSSAGKTTNDFRAFSYGFPAENSAVPATGTGTYTGIAIGRATSPSGTHVYDLTGSFSFTADYGARTFSGTVTLNGTDDRTGAPIALGTFPITMSSYPTQLNAISANIGSGRDIFRAYLAGTTAEELAGVFTLTLPDPNELGATLTISAAVAGRR